MNDLITVFYNKSPLLLKKLVADDLGYKGGETLTQAQVWEAIQADAAAGIAACKLGSMAGAKC